MKRWLIRLEHVNQTPFGESSRYGIAWVVRTIVDGVDTGPTTRFPKSRLRDAHTHALRECTRHYGAPR